MEEETLNCGNARPEPFDASIGLRIGAIFIIGASSMAMTLFPVITGRIPKCQIPVPFFDFAKFFGSGVIIATAFIHLLAPGIEELGSPCLNADFQSYPFALAFSMIAVFVTFFVELIAFRIGSKIARNLAYDPHTGGHHHANEHAVSDGPIQAPVIEQEYEGDESLKEKVSHSHSHADVEKGDQTLSAAASQILGVAVLEFGVIFHSVIIGITLGTTTESFTTLFIVIIFHQMFEGLGLGTRLAALPLKPKSPIPFIGAISYSIVTPIGMAIGLGVRHTYNGESAKASYITGTFDSVSSGILLYTGLVELLAHEFIFNEKMRTAPLGKVLLNVGEMMLGAGIMALLGKMGLKELHSFHCHRSYLIKILFFSFVALLLHHYIGCTIVSLLSRWFLLSPFPIDSAFPSVHIFTQIHHTLFYKPPKRFFSSCQESFTNINVNLDDGSL